MASHQIPIPRRTAGIRLDRPQVASWALIIRAVLFGLSLAFLLVWALPQARIAVASRAVQIHSET